MSEIKNITTGSSSLKFSLVIILIYKVTVPLVQNQSFIIQNIQKASLSQCNFNVTNVTVTSVSSPLEKSYTVKLNTGSRKKRGTSAGCSNDEAEFLAICPSSNQLTQCNKVGLTIFLNQYINKAVKVLS